MKFEKKENFLEMDTKSGNVFGYSLNDKGCMVITKNGESLPKS